MGDSEKQKSGPKRNSSAVKIASFVVLASIGLVLFIAFREQLSLDYLAEHEDWLRGLQQSQPLLVFLVAAIIYVVVTGFSLPGGATVLTLVYAWYFGFFPALALVSVSSTAGATVAFLSSRYFFRDFFTSKFGERLRSFNENLEKDGAFYLFSLRLIPAVPFFLINILMGLTPIRTSTFWWVSQLGMLPGTAVYVYFGSTFPKLSELSEKGFAGILKWELAVAFVLLGVTPLIIKKLFGWFSQREIPSETESEDRQEIDPTSGA